MRRRDGELADCRKRDEIVAGEDRVVQSGQRDGGGQL